jgi:gibberellin 20-oxidase
MKKLSQVILELLAISLGVDQLHYKKFFEDAETMMRCNSYPPCSGINVGTLGTVTQLQSPFFPKTMLEV